MHPDSDQPRMPSDDPAERRGEPDGRNYLLMFVIYGALMLLFHPAFVEDVFGLRHMFSPYRKVYCVAMILLVLRGLVSSQKALFWLGVVAALMFGTVLLLPTLS
jgi:hypothetical protein